MQKNDMEFWNEQVRWSYGPVYNGNHPELSKLRGYNLRWRDNVALNDVNCEHGSTKFEVPKEKMDKLMETLITSWNDKTTFESITTLVADTIGYKGYRTFFID